MGFFESLKRGLAKTRNSLMSGFDVLFGAYDEVDDDFFEELEEILVLSDMGMETAARIVAQLEQETIDRHLTRPAQVRKMLLEDLEKLMGEQDNTIVDDDRMSVLMLR